MFRNRPHRSHWITLVGCGLLVTDVALAGDEPKDDWPGPDVAEPASADDDRSAQKSCRTESACTVAGLCTLQDSLQCVAATDADCRRAEICTEAGRCTALGGKCVADRDDDCQASQTCQLHGNCVADHGVCAEPEPAQKEDNSSKPERRDTAGAEPAGRVKTTWDDGLPDTLPYYQDEQTPDGFYLAERPRYELIGTGIGILGGTWLASMGTAIYYDNEPDGSDDPNFDDNYWPLFIPVAGPFVAIGTADSSGTGAAILALDGVVQAGALAMIIAGYAAPRTELVRKEWHFDISPVVSSQMTGVGVSGSM